MKNNIIELPVLKGLKEEVEKLRTTISEKLLERDHLLFHECKNIESAYLMAFGALEYKVYEAECLYNRTRRKLELIIAKRNRQENLELDEIEEVLDEEFEEYKQQLNEKIEQMNEALERSKGRVLTDEESSIMKKLYRQIVKKLHPDLNPELSDAKKELFRNTVEAYERGDLMTIKIINEMVCDDCSEIETNKNDTLGFCMKEKARLTEVIEGLTQKIEEIKNDFPYLLSIYIEDKGKAEEKKEDLESWYDFFKSGIKKYEKEITEYVGERTNGQ